MVTNAAIAANCSGMRAQHGVEHGAEAKLASWARRRANRPCCGAGAGLASMPGAPHHAGQTSLTRQASQDQGKDSGHALAICGVLWSGLRPFRRTPQMASAPARCIMPPQLPPDLRGFRPPRHPHRDTIRLAHECRVHPRFYRSVGRDPEAATAAGIAALQELYSPNRSRPMTVQQRQQIERQIIQRIVTGCTRCRISNHRR